MRVGKIFRFLFIRLFYFQLFFFSLSKIIIKVCLFTEVEKHGATNFGPSDLSSTIDCEENWDLENDDDSFAEESSPMYSNIDLK